MFHKLLTDFGQYLKENGFDIPFSAKEEVIQLLPYLNLNHRAEFQESLRQLWVKDAHLFERFDLCFHEYFIVQVHEKVATIEKRMQDKKKEQAIQKTLESLESQKAELADKKQAKDEWEWLKDKLVQMQDGTKRGKMAQLVEQLIEGKYSTLIQNEHLKDHSKPQEITDLTEDLMWEAITEGKGSMVFDMIAETSKEMNSFRKEVLKIKNMERTMISEVAKTEQIGMRKVIKTTIDKLKERNIESLKKDDIAELKQHIQETSAHFLTKISRLLQQTKVQDDIDMAKTIEKSKETFGIPMELLYRKPKIKKTKIDILLDVSGSVVKSAEFLSLFAYLIHQEFPNQVRSFVFVGELAEVTDFYNMEDSTEAVRSSLKNAPIDYRGYSNYDMALTRYQDRYMDEVDKDTIVFFLGDARNNRNDSRVDIVEKIKDQAKAFVWFNPEPKKKWGKGDSVMHKYQEHCDEVYQTLNMNELEEALYGVATNIA